MKTSAKKSAEMALIEKADLTIQDLLDDGGLMLPEMANTFLRKIMDTTTIWSAVRQVPMARSEIRIPTIVSNNRMLRVARNQYTDAANGNDGTGLTWGYGTPNRGLSMAERSKLTTGLITMKTDEVIAVMDLTYEMLEDIVEGGAIDGTDFQTLVLDLMAAQISLDLEEKLVLGDTASGDDFLALQDGLLKFPTSNIVNQNNAPISHLLFVSMIKALPVKYRAKLATMKFYVNSNVELDYRAQLAQRQTALGDGMLTGTQPVSILGVPMVRCGFLPTTNIILTDPRNILVGIQRKFRLATERHEEMRMIKIVVTMRVGQQVEDEVAMVKAINVGTFL
jgi:HK97 family phage major capsid protein